MTDFILDRDVESMRRADLRHAMGEMVLVLSKCKKQKPGGVLGVLSRLAAWPVHIYSL